MASLALAWLAGAALQLQQNDIWPMPVYLAMLACGLALAVAAACLCRGAGWRRAAGLVVALVAAATLAFGQAGWRGAQRVAEILPAALEGRDLIATGRVQGLPQVDAEGQHFVFSPDSAHDARSGEDLQLPSRVWLSWPRGESGAAGSGGAVDQVRAGERWQLPLKLKQPHGAMNPGGFDAELWFFEQGLGASGTVRAAAASDPRRMSGWRWWRPDEVADHLRQRWRDAALLRGTDARVGGVLAALAVGDQSAIDAPGWAVFRQTGVAHLMSISGLHITMFAWLASSLLGRLWRMHPTWPLWWPAPLAGRWGGVLMAAAYAGIAGWGVPAQRTVWMLAMSVGLSQAGLRWPPLLVCLWAGAVVVAFDPWALLQPGFWLSFVAVAILLASDSPLETPPADTPHGAPDLAPKGWLARLRVGVEGGVRQQIIATVALAPLTLVLFGQISLVGFLANLVAVPWVTLVVTPLALAGLLVPPAWTMAGWALQPLLGLLSWLASWPWAVWPVPASAPWAAVAAMAGGALLVLPLPWRARLAGLPLWLPLLWPGVARPEPGRFELLAADVGQGSAIIVRTAHHLLLHDTGPTYGLDADAGQRVLVPLLRSIGEARVDMLVLSHRDSDHVGGAPAVLAASLVGELRTALEPGHPLRHSVDMSGAPVPHVDCEAGQFWEWDGVRFRVLHPLAGAWHPGIKPNAMSCVVRVEDAEGHSALLTGDLEAEQEAGLVDTLGPAALHSDALIVPHHGSKTSSTTAFLQAVAPRVAVIQVGYRSRFGHPHPSVLARYADLGIPIVRSDHCGAWVSNKLGARCTREVHRRYWHWKAPATSPEGGAVVASDPSRGVSE